MHRISYELSHQYPSGLEGIFLPVSLRLGQEAVVIEAAVDAGASYCLFAHSVGEKALELMSNRPPTLTMED